MALLDDTFAAPAPSGRVALGRQIYDYFVARGLPPHQAAAIAGNMAWEGGGRTDLVNPGDNVRNSPNAPHSIGIAQWNDRSPALVAFARSQGIDVPAGDLRDANYAREVARRIPLQTQLEFAWQEMQGPERRAYDAITSGGDVRSATAGAIGYHRPAGFTWGNPTGGHGFDGRLSLANQILGGGATTDGTTPAETSSPPPAPEAQSSGGLLSGVFGALEGQNASGPFAAFADAPRVSTAQLARSEMETATPDEMRLMAPRTPQLDLTRLRALIQGSGRLGTMRG